MRSGNPAARARPAAMHGSSRRRLPGFARSGDPSKASGDAVEDHLQNRTFCIFQSYFPNPASSDAPNARADQSKRSEEHTSELQSHLNLVCRLLLEKKK